MVKTQLKKILSKYVSTCPPPITFKEHFTPIRLGLSDLDLEVPMGDWILMPNYYVIFGENMYC